MAWCATIFIVLSVACGEPAPGTEETESLSTKEQALTKVTVPEAVAAGASHSLYLRKNGEVSAWGHNAFGQLGTGTLTSSPQPTRLTTLPAIKAISAGLNHSLALDTEGSVWVWGQNVSGQVGIGTAGGTVPAPVKLASLPAIQAIAANGNFSLALGMDGRVWAWGQNNFGQVGTGSVTPAAVPSPVTVAGLPTIRAIAAGHFHALALDADGRVWGWGQNTSGQVGTGNTVSPVLTPTQVARDLRVTAIAAGAGHSLVIQESSGNVWAWGQNNFGQVGTGGTSTAPVLAPAPVNGTFAVTAIAAGQAFSVAVMGGFTKTWGQNSFGQLGDGTTATRAAPVNAAGMTAVKAIAAGSSHVLAVRPGCPVWAWGNNGQGQLGNGLASSTAHPNPLQNAVTNTYYSDYDMDGFGDEFMALEACEAPEGFVEELDCDDYTPTTFPGAPELCNGVDDSCDGAVDDGNPGGNETCSTGKPGICAGGTTACTDGAIACVQNEEASAEQCDGLDNDCDGESDDGNPEGTQECTTGQQGVCGGGVTYCTSGTIHCVPEVSASSEVCDGLDNDCDGQSDEELALLTWYRDADGDGFGQAGQAGQNCRQPTGYVGNSTDCDDTNRLLNPGAAEVCDGADNNCNAQADEGLPVQTWYRDADADTYGTSSQSVQDCRQPAGHVSRAADCNDGNAALNPGASEVCDGVDNNCNGSADDGLSTQTWYRDEDGDGFGTSAQSTQSCQQPSGHAAVAGDCNDTSAGIKPGGTEVCDGLDNDCDTVVDDGLMRTWYRDQDADGHGGSQSTQACAQPSGYVSATGDCNDANASFHPGMAETCDGQDNNCNGSVDDGLTAHTWYLDADGDGHGTSSVSAQNCRQPSGYVSNASDCNDSNGNIKPGVTEVCDSVDNNCAGGVDEGLTVSTWYRDSDGDGYGSASQSTQYCAQPSGYVSNASDCNDGNGSIRPGATEVCDGVDNNCAGGVDEGVKSTFYLDADGDNFGNPNASTQACSQPSGYVTNTSDCNDSNGSIRPGASEVCDSVDNNCSGGVDEGLTVSTWYRDSDGDGYGASGVSTQYCAQPSGYVSNASDCNDGSAGIRPGATEVCDGVDNNCSGGVDEGVKSTFYRDADGDGYGSSATPTQACSQPSGYVPSASDCNDSNGSIRPGASEVCDSVDNNCSGGVDEGLTVSTWYRDSDGDGYGTSSQTTQYCAQPSGYVSNASDCNDGSAAIRPGGTEVCDGVDNNCSGGVDEGVKPTFYRDADGDGYGTAGTSTQACSQPSGYVSNASDCNDGNGSIRPGAAETCDSVDNNCSGGVDEGLTYHTWYRDADGDGYGTSSQATQYCSQPSGYVSNASDCHDGSSVIRPGSTEVCDGVDNNCSGAVDEGVQSTWYRDADGDGAGNGSLTTLACSRPSGYVANADDCNDANGSNSPYNEEWCGDGQDNNCNGAYEESCDDGCQPDPFPPYEDCQPDW